jgi:hypothetical protein
LAVDDSGGGAGFSFRSFAAFDVERVMNASEDAVALPPNEVVVDRTARRDRDADLEPIVALIRDQACDLEADVLPVVQGEERNGDEDSNGPHRYRPIIEPPMIIAFAAARCLCMSIAARRSNGGSRRL